MSRWSADSDYDYYEQVEARHTWARETTLHCICCDQPVTVEFDEPGPVRCARCQRIDPRNDATGYSHPEVA